MGASTTLLLVAWALLSVRHATSAAVEYSSIWVQGGVAVQEGGTDCSADAASWNDPVEIQCGTNTTSLGILPVGSVCIDGDALLVYQQFPFCQQPTPLRVPLPLVGPVRMCTYNGVPDDDYNSCVGQYIRPADNPHSTTAANVLIIAGAVVLIGIVVCLAWARYFGKLIWKGRGWQQQWANPGELAPLSGAANAPPNSCRRYAPCMLGAAVVCFIAAVVVAATLWLVLVVDVSGPHCPRKPAKPKDQCVVTYGTPSTLSGPSGCHPSDRPSPAQIVSVDMSARGKTLVFDTEGETLGQQGVTGLAVNESFSLTLIEGSSVPDMCPLSVLRGASFATLDSVFTPTTSASGVTSLVIDLSNMGSCWSAPVEFELSWMWTNASSNYYQHSCQPVLGYGESRSIEICSFSYCQGDDVACGGSCHAKTSCKACVNKACVA